MATKKELIKLINDFVGEGGYVPFEHGYRPHINAFGVGYGFIDHKLDSKTSLEDLTVAELQTTVNDLMGYWNYCHKEA